MPPPRGTYLAKTTLRTRQAYPLVGPVHKILGAIDPHPVPDRACGHEELALRVVRVATAVPVKGIAKARDLALVS